MQMVAKLPPEVGREIGQAACCNHHIASGAAREGAVQCSSTNVSFLGGGGTSSIGVFLRNDFFLFWMSQIWGLVFGPQN